MTVPEIIDFFIPDPDIRKRHSITVDAPTDLVYETACNFDLQSIPLVHFIFRLREILMGSSSPSSDNNEITSLTLLNNGWGKLAEKDEHYLIAGAACQPWEADVVFSPIPAEHFSTYSEPEQIKIVWTLETETLGPNQTRLSTETRVVATDEKAKMKFRRYWRRFKIGIIAIRLLLLPAIRQKAENISRINESNKSSNVNWKKNEAG